MKRLILIGGPMGVGKTAACRALQKRLPNCVFLDGDWCWDASPFIVTEETKALAADNIVHLLTSFLACSAYETVLFCWVMHLPEIQQSLLSRLPLTGCRVDAFSLICTEEALRSRLQTDVDAGLREPGVIGRALAYLPLYPSLNRPCIDTTFFTAGQTAEAVLSRLSYGEG